jgi:hypothetical protein
VTVPSLVFAIIQIGYGFPSMHLSRSRAVNVMTHKFLTKPEVTDTDRYDRFVAMTQQIGALDDLKNFEKAFQKAFKSAFENVDCSRRLADIERTVRARATTLSATELNSQNPGRSKAPKVRRSLSSRSSRSWTRDHQ